MKTYWNYLIIFISPEIPPSAPLYCEHALLKNRASQKPPRPVPRLLITSLFIGMLHNLADTQRGGGSGGDCGDTIKRLGAIGQVG